MSEYKDIVGIVKFQDGTYDCYHDSAGVPPSIDYIKLEIADQLAEALEYVAADMNDSMPIPSDVILRVTEALTTYRKAKGE